MKRRGFNCLAHWPSVLRPGPVLHFGLANQEDGTEVLSLFIETEGGEGGPAVFLTDDEALDLAARLEDTVTNRPPIRHCQQCGTPIRFKTFPDGRQITSCDRCRDLWGVT